MNLPEPQEQEIIESWYSNAAPWTRAIRSLGMSVTGIDVVPELIAQAAAMPRAGASGIVSFHVQDYASIANRRWQGGRFDAAVCNFSLLGGNRWKR